MQVINPFSIILLGIIGYLICSSKSTKSLYINFLILTIVINALTIQGYFVYFLGTERSYDFIVNIVYTFIAVYYCKKNDAFLYFGTVKWGSFLILSVLCGTFYFILDPFDGYVVNGGAGFSWDDYATGANVEGFPQLHFQPIIFDILYFINVILTVIIVRDNLLYEDYVHIIRKVLKFLYIYLAYGVFEFFIKNFINSQILYDINGWFWGVGDSTYISSMERGTFEALQGFAREPSHYVFTLFLLLVFIFVKDKCLMHTPFSKKEISAIFISFFIMIVSGSFASLIYISSFVALLIVYKINFLSKWRRITIYSILGILLSGVIIYIATIGLDDDSYLGSRINASFLVLSLLSTNALRGIGGLSSALPRFMSIYETGLDFLERPLLGVGPHIESCHSGWMTFLSYYGIVGAILWFKTIFSRGKYDIMMIIIFMVLPHILVGLINWVITLPSVFIVLMLRKDYVMGYVDHN